MFDIPELLEHFRGKIPEFFLKDHEYSFHLFTTGTQDFVLIYGEKKYFLIEKATWVLYMYFCIGIGYEKAIVKHVKREDWYMWAHMSKGGITLPMFTSLDAYWPGIQVIHCYRCMRKIILKI